MWVTTLHRWFDYWLQGVANGIMDEPRVDLERRRRRVGDHTPTGRSRAQADTELFLKPGTTGAGGLGLVPTAKPATGAFQDSRTQSQNTMILNPDAVQPNRLAFLSAPLTAPLHISGTPTVQLGPPPTRPTQPRGDPGRLRHRRAGGAPGLRRGHQSP